MCTSKNQNILIFDTFSARTPCVLKKTVSANYHVTYSIRPYNSMLQREPDDNTHVQRRV